MRAGCCRGSAWGWFAFLCSRKVGIDVGFEVSVEDGAEVSVEDGAEICVEADGEVSVVDCEEGDWVLSGT